MKNGTTEKIRVGIVLGGISSEKEISLESGRNIFGKTDKARYEPVPIFMDSRGFLWEIPLKLLMRNSTRDVELDLETEARRIPYESLSGRVDIVYVGLHGKYGEDGCFQGLLELLRIPYVGAGVLGSALGMDKYMGRKVLAMSGIAVPETVPVMGPEWDEGRERIIDALGEKPGFPCIVKPSREGCSTAVAKVVSAGDLPAALDAALQWDTIALVEEFVEGMEVTCGVIGNDAPMALTPSETIPTASVLSLEDKFLYGQGENKTPARLPGHVLERIQETAISAFRALNLKVYARIDMIVRPGGEIVVLEPNSLPGMTPSTVLFHQAAASGITQSELIDRILTLSFEAHASKKGPL